MIKKMPVYDRFPDVSFSFWSYPPKSEEGHYILAENAREYNDLKKTLQESRAQKTHPRPLTPSEEKTLSAMNRLLFGVIRDKSRPFGLRVAAVETVEAIDRWDGFSNPELFSSLKKDWRAKRCKFCFRLNLISHSCKCGENEQIDSAPYFVFNRRLIVELSNTLDFEQAQKIVMEIYFPERPEDGWMYLAALSRIEKA